MKNFMNLIKLVVDRKDLILFASIVLMSVIETTLSSGANIVLLNALDNLDALNIATGYITIYALIQILSITIEYLYKKRSTKFNATVGNKTRERLLDKVLHLDSKDFYNQSTGYIQDVITRSNQVTLVLKISLRVLEAITLMVSTLIFVYTIDPKVSIVYAIAAPIIGVVYTHFWKIEMSASEKLDHYRKVVTGLVSNAVKGFRTVKAFNRTDAEVSKITLIGNNWTDETMIARKAKSTTDAFISASFLVIELVIILYCIMTGRSAQEILILASYTKSIFNSVIMITENSEDLQDAIVSSNRIFELLETENSIIDGSVNLTSFSDSIKFDGVHFGYTGNTEILSDISFTIKKGQRIGICGPSGGGKSTMLTLLMRFYDVTKGSINIDGINIKDMTMQSLRNRIGIVQQDAYLFEGTIMENILYGKPSATEYEVIEAAKKANIHDFITSLEDGYKSQVGDNGIKLSGGQKQRISIARVFLQNPDIILFDEATAALDNNSEKIIQESIEQLSSDKTIITVAHRLSTIKDCDTILVVNNRQIVESGDYKTLIAKDGLFAKLANKQAS